LQLVGVHDRRDLHFSVEFHEKWLGEWRDFEASGRSEIEEDREPSIESREVSHLWLPPLGSLLHDLGHHPASDALLPDSIGIEIRVITHILRTFGAISPAARLNDRMHPLDRGWCRLGSRQHVDGIHPNRPDRYDHPVGVVAVESFEVSPVLLADAISECVVWIVAYFSITSDLQVSGGS
jgi:hypothetical protein